MTSDPIGLDGGLNTFGYVKNQPTISVDPYGLNPFLVVVPKPGPIANPIASPVPGVSDVDNDGIDDNVVPFPGRGDTQSKGENCPAEPEEKDPCVVEWNYLRGLWEDIRRIESTRSLPWDQIKQMKRYYNDHAERYNDTCAALGKYPTAPKYSIFELR